ncbi:unnamed protein product [Arctogadus glacialis]
MFHCERFVETVHLHGPTYQGSSLCCQTVSCWAGIDPEASPLSGHRGEEDWRLLSVVLKLSGPSLAEHG